MPCSPCTVTSSPVSNAPTIDLSIGFDVSDHRFVLSPPLRNRGVANAPVPSGCAEHDVRARREWSSVAGRNGRRDGGSPAMPDATALFPQTAHDHAPSCRRHR